MTDSRSTLPLSSMVSLAASALAGQGEYGLVSRLADEHEVSRHDVYAFRDRGRVALETCFGSSTGEFWDPTGGAGEADMRRLVVALRVVTPSSIRDIEELLPVVFNTHWSYGKIQSILVEAEERAAAWLGGVELSNIESVALDEMFSQGKPVLGGVDLDYGYLFSLDISPTRSGAEWAAVLGALAHDQGLAPSFVVKDAGSGLAAGVSATWPEAEQRDDLFHAVYDMGKLARRLESVAYGAITRVEEAQCKRARAKTAKQRRRCGQLVRRAVDEMEERIERYDVFETLRREATNLLELADRGSGRLRRSSEVREGLVRIAKEMDAIGGHQIHRLATYLTNRAAGLASYLDTMHELLDIVTTEAGGAEMVQAILRAWQARIKVQQGGPLWDRQARATELKAAAAHLFGLADRSEVPLQDAVGLVLPIINARHRASSPIENLNSVLRPYLVVQKSANQGFLDLFRFYWNTRKRRWGRWKGTSATEVMTGQPHEHWLTLLGFPPSRTQAVAA